ncbi:MAG: TonB-dependent receptor [Rhodobacterales bacterium]|nr:TonB-dependent receptor [Rhodobacterales bacterium]
MTRTQHLLWLGCACCTAWPGVTSAHAPADSSVDEMPVAGDRSARLERKATLVYPSEARAAAQHADVTLLVDVDQSGAVTNAQIESAPDVFREAALAAAFTLGFSPATRNGEPIASTVRVFFHYAPAKEDEPIEEVLVQASDPDRLDTHARTTLDDATLERSAGDDLAETMEQVPGVTLSRGTADAAKPVIRGHQERRLLVLNDGIRHESQKWGPDHATEIDPFSAGTVSIIRGAAGARYGPDAIGGVVLVQPPPMRTEPGIGGKTVVAYTANGRRPYGAVRLDAVPTKLKQVAIRVEGNASRGASLSTPTYVLGNTGSQQWNLGLSTRYRWDTGQVRALFHHYDFRAGVFYGVQNSTPSDFEEQLSAARPATADLWSTTYAIDRPYQRVSHDLLSLHATEAGDWGSVEAIYAFQSNHRQEFEQVRESITGSQFDFLLRTHSVDVSYDPPTAQLGSSQLDGKIGTQGVFQENVFRGLSLLPNYRALSGGLFAVQRLTFDRLELEVGGRYDRLSRTAFLDRLDYERHLRRDTLQVDDCTLRDNDGGRCPSQYGAATQSLGGLAELVPDHVDLKLDVSSATRFPNADELYLIGSAPSFPVYAVGNPALGVETAWTASPTLTLRTSWLNAEVSGFTSWIDDFIYFSPERNAAGRLRFDVTIRGTWPTYGYQPIDALIHGVDGGLALGPQSLFGLDIRGALVRATNAQTDEHLIGTPPDYLSATAIFRPHIRGAVEKPELSFTTDLVGRQSRVDATADYAPAPDGVVLLSASAETEIDIRGRNLRIGLDAHNLLNTRYREYTSLLRYYADQPGRDLRVRVGIDI